MREARGCPGLSSDLGIEERRPVPLTWRWFVGRRALTERTVPKVLERMIEQKDEALFFRGSRRFEYEDN